MPDAIPSSGSRVSRERSPSASCSYAATNAFVALPHDYTPKTVVPTTGLAKFPLTAGRGPAPTSSPQKEMGGCPTGPGGHPLVSAVDGHRCCEQHDQHHAEVHYRVHHVRHTSGALDLHGPPPIGSPTTCMRPVPVTPHHATGLPVRPVVARGWRVDRRQQDTVAAVVLARGLVGPFCGGTDGFGEVGPNGRRGVFAPRSWTFTDLPVTLGPA